MSAAHIAITIVTFNSERYIEGCLEHALAQDHESVEIVVVDNASDDGTRALLAKYDGRVRTLFNQQNTGFAAAQNQAMSAAASNTEWFLTLNPDVRLTTSFVSTLLRAAKCMDRVGSLCGKLLASSPSFEVASPPLLDSTGIFFTRELRHLDRGNRAPDEGQYDVTELVFGGTGAACLYRKATIEDVSVEGEFFDPDFFAYREDADVAWRAQLLGWSCLYVPEAVALHVRTVLSENRTSLPALINMHSVKNRWLQRIKNMTPDLYRRLWMPVTVRDVMVIAGCLLREWSSLPGFPMVLRLYPRALAKRRDIMRRRRASDQDIAQWFSDRPVSFPIPANRC